jgi:Helix-turn-helix domain
MRAVKTIIENLVVLPDTHRVNMRLTYKYWLCPTKAQEAKLDEWLESLRLLYNFALAEKRTSTRRRAVPSPYTNRNAPCLTSSAVFLATWVCIPSIAGHALSSR